MYSETYTENVTMVGRDLNKEEKRDNGKFVFRMRVLYFKQMHVYK